MNFGPVLATLRFQYGVSFLSLIQLNYAMNQTRAIPGTKDRVSGSIKAIRDMALFVEVARTRSLTSASKVLSVSPSTLSRRLTALEAEMGVRLLQRSTRRIELTEAGAAYFALSEDLTVNALRLYEQLRAGGDHLSGSLSVSTRAEYGLRFLSGIVSDFIRLHPQLNLELMLSSHSSEQCAPHDGVSLHLGEVAQGDAVVRHVGLIERKLYASPGYLATSPELRTPHDLRAHSCIVAGHGVGLGLWSLRSGEMQVDLDVKGALASNNVSMRARLARDGFGVVVLPDALAEDLVRQGGLVRVLEGWRMPPVPLLAAVREKSSQAAAGVFIDWLEKRLRPAGGAADGFA
jgi:DNA-binding transcriptional LysR family regulator